MHSCNKPFQNTAGHWTCVRDEGHTGICGAEPRVVYDQSAHPIGLMVEKRHQAAAKLMLSPGSSEADIAFCANHFAHFEAELDRK